MDAAGSHQVRFQKAERVVGERVLARVSQLAVACTLDRKNSMVCGSESRSCSSNSAVYVLVAESSRLNRWWDLRHARKIAGHASGDTECTVWRSRCSQIFSRSASFLQVVLGRPPSIRPGMGAPRCCIPRDQSRKQADALFSEGVDEIFYEVPVELETASPACALEQLLLYSTRQLSTLQRD